MGGIRRRCMVRILHVNSLTWMLASRVLSSTFKGRGNDEPRAGGDGMTPKEWSIEAFDMCDHGGLICLSCAEKAIKAAIEEDRERWLGEAQKQNGDDELLREEAPSILTSPA